MSATDGNKINSYLADNAGKSRNVGRTIVFAIIAASWSMSYANGNFSPTIWIKTSILLSIIYLTMDLLIYFILTCIYKYYLCKYFKPTKDGDFQYKSNNINLEGKTRLWHEVCFYWIVIMSLILLASSAFLIIHVVSLIKA